MMRPIILKAAMFRNHGDDPIEHIRSRVSMLFLLEWLTLHDRLWLRMYPNTPKIYESGVEYIYKDADEAPAWQDISVCLAKKTGDCKDFAAWRCAELRESGVDCRPVIQWRKMGDAYRFHALVEHRDGTLEDPSKFLGMGGDSSFITPPEYSEETQPGETKNMDSNKTAEAVVRGLLLGDSETKNRAKSSLAKLKEMSTTDSDCARACATVQRICGYVRTGVERGDEDLEGLITAALNPSKKRSILAPENVRGFQVYNMREIESVLGLSETEQSEIAAPAAALLSVLVPGGGLLAPLTPLAVKGADDLITKAQGGDKKAIGTIADTRAKAAQGDTQAKADLDALKRVSAAKKATKDAVIQASAPSSWNPLVLYRAGIGPTIH